MNKCYLSIIETYCLIVITIKSCIYDTIVGMNALWGNSRGGSKKLKHCVSSFKALNKNFPRDLRVQLLTTHGEGVRSRNINQSNGRKQDISHNSALLIIF